MYTRCLKILSNFKNCQKNQNEVAQKTWKILCTDFKKYKFTKPVFVKASEINMFAKTLYSPCTEKKYYATNERFVTLDISVSLLKFYR